MFVFRKIWRSLFLGTPVLSFSLLPYFLHNLNLTVFLKFLEIPIFENVEYMKGLSWNGTNSKKKKKKKIKYAKLWAQNYQFEFFLTWGIPFKTGQKVFLKILKILLHVFIYFNTGNISSNKLILIQKTTFMFWNESS